MPRSDYEFLNELGRGSFGVVFKVERKVDVVPLVCKQINLKGMSVKMQSEAREEVALLKKVSKGCDFIVQYVESFLEDNTLHIVMEFCAMGDLSDYLRDKVKNGETMHEDTIWKFVIQVAQGLRWLHANRILHRDIKPLNVFLTATEHARIGDLGVARMLGRDTNFAHTLIGTPFYLSPEVCNQQRYNDKSDVWAFGCVAYEMCALKRPFEAKNSAALLMKIMEGKYDPLPAEISSDLKLVTSMCLELTPDKRASMEQVLALPVVIDHMAKLIESAASHGEESNSPKRAKKWRRWRQLTAQIQKLYGDVVKELDEPTRQIWDDLYMLFRTKMASDDLSDSDYTEIEKHIFEELPTENTDLIMKVAKLLQLEAEADSIYEDLRPTAGVLLDSGSCTSLHGTTSTTALGLTSGTTASIT